MTLELGAQRYFAQLPTFAKNFMSEGRMMISGIEEILRASGASEKSNGIPSAGGYRG